MVLMQISPVMRQYQLGLIGFQRLEVVLQGGPIVRKIAATERLDANCCVVRSRKQAGSRGTRFSGALGVGTEGYPNEPCGGPSFNHVQYSAAAANLQVIAMRAQ